MTTRKVNEVLQAHMDEQGRIRWPADEEARVELAQTLLALEFVGSCDVLYKACRDLAQNPQPAQPYVRPDSAYARRDAYFRSVLATLNDEQREAVLRLLHEQIYGAVYSMLVNLDQLPDAEVRVILRQREGDPPFEVQAAPGWRDIGIHEQWGGWVREFAAFPTFDHDDAPPQTP